jgi:transposase
MHGQYEQSEEVEVLERRFVLKRHKRLKYRCGRGGCVEAAPAPLKLVPGGRYSLEFAIEVAVQKYLDPLPLLWQRRWATWVTCGRG